MKDLKLLFNRAIEELDCIGIEYGNIVDITVNTRAKSRWGQCRKRGCGYFININERLLHDDITDEDALSTIIHEILHTCKGCMNHGYEWQKLAELVNDCYACYNIKRCTSAEEKGIEGYNNNESYRYGIYCPKCNKIIGKRQKWSKALNNIERYSCAVCSCRTLNVINLI